MLDKRVSTVAEGISWPEVEERIIFSFVLLLFAKAYLNTDLFLSTVS